MSAVKLSAPMVRMLVRVRDTGTPFEPIKPGLMWTTGSNTLAALVKRGLVTYNCTDHVTGEGVWELTGQGREMIS